MSDDALTSPAIDVQGVRERRESMRLACQQIQRLLDAVSIDERTPPEDLAAAVERLADRWAAHVSQTESPTGILNQVVTDSPRLSTTAARLQDDHTLVGDRIRAAQRLLAVEPADLPEVRHQLDAAIAAIDKHRQGGNDLLYKAYSIDIGLGE